MTRGAGGRHSFFEFKGIEKMSGKLKKIAANHPDRVAAALRIEGELIMTDSKRNYVPVDLGVLRSSGHVGPVTRGGKMGREMSITLSYGGAASAYALAVHEHPSPHSPPSWRKGKLGGKGGGRTGVRLGGVVFNPRGRGPKYLEKPLKKALRGMAARVAKRIKL